MAFHAYFAFRVQKARERGRAKIGGLLRATDAIKAVQDVQKKQAETVLESMHEQHSVRDLSSQSAVQVSPMSLTPLESNDQGAPGAMAVTLEHQVEKSDDITCSDVEAADFQ